MGSSLLGNVCALGGASVWAVSSLLFARTRMSPFALNLGKNCIAVAAFVATLAVMAACSDRALFRADASIVGTLAASSVIGLVLGDWFHFRALRLLGPRKALVLETLAPVFAAAIAFTARHETLTLLQMGGIGATLCGVALVVGEAHGGDRPLTSNERWLGALFGVLAAFGQALGATLSKIAVVALAQRPGGAASPALEASTIRLLVAAGVGLAIAIVARGPRAEARALVGHGQWRLVAPAALLATYAGVWLSLLAFQHAKVAVASTLLALSPVMVLPLVSFFFDERLSGRAIAGALISVGGTALLFLT